MTKELLFSVRRKDLKLEYFSGSGAGGQHRNRHKNCVRCKHPASGAVGSCQEHRSKIQNEKIAFRRMIDTKELQSWVRLEASRITGELGEIEDRVDKELNRVKLEVKVDGKWTETKEEELSGEGSEDA